MTAESVAKELLAIVAAELGHGTCQEAAPAILRNLAAYLMKAGLVPDGTDIAMEAGASVVFKDSRHRP